MPAKAKLKSRSRRSGRCWSIELAASCSSAGIDDDDDDDDDDSNACLSPRSFCLYKSIYCFSFKPLSDCEPSAGMARAHRTATPRTAPHCTAPHRTTPHACSNIRTHPARCIAVLRGVNACKCREPQANDADGVNEREGCRFCVQSPAMALRTIAAVKNVGFDRGRQRLSFHRTNDADELTIGERFRSMALRRAGQRPRWAGLGWAAVRSRCDVHCDAISRDTKRCRGVEFLLLRCEGGIHLMTKRSTIEPQCLFGGWFYLAMTNNAMHSMSCGNIA